MTEPAPWVVGDLESRWNGYLLEPGSSVLRNKLGLTDSAALSAAENDLVEFRVAELRERPELVTWTFDLTHLQGLHGQFFQDVYEWAGELRTVGLAKGGGESFIPPGDIARPVAHVAERIADTNQLRDLPDEDLPEVVAYLYDYLNFAHPFREGNGRTQREFFEQLMARSGRGMEWSLVEMDELHSACHVARNDMVLEPLTQIMRTVIVDSSSY